MSTGRMSVVLAACVLSALAACTPAPVTPTRAPTPPTPSPTLTIAPQVELTCGQGNAQDAPIPPDLRLTETVGTNFVRHPVSKLPRAQDVGVAAPSSIWRFNKSPLSLEGAATVTISVPDDGRQYLLWVPSTAWGGEATHVAQREWIAHQVVATGCDRGGVFFFGGILAIYPERCFTLSIESAGTPRLDLDVRADGGHCPA